MRPQLICLLILIFCSGTDCLLSQNTFQNIKGTVVDAESGIPLPGATIVILDTDPLKGTITDSHGLFRIDSLPTGRYNIQVRYVGYEPYIVKELLVSSGKEVILNVLLIESVAQIDQVTIRANSNKSEPVNSMSTLSAKQISMEEANRYAGGFDDPARLVSSYAGVAYSIGNNGIVIRGNAPKGLLWRMEGIQIPNPNHFADFISLGGGAVTALSSQTMANSDFLTGAFPAEFGNALSGVFDIKMRTGNSEKREYVFQAGGVGIDVASEGPFIKGKQSSYLFNYRYSTLGLLSPILPEEMGVLKYQDLSFKLNFPTKKAGVFSLWGIGAMDYQGKLAVMDSLEWETSDDRKEYITRLSMGAAGLSHKKIIGNKTYIQTTLAITENSVGWEQKRLNNELNLQPKRELKDYRWNYTLSGFVNHKFSARHANKTGFIFNHLNYNMDIKKAEEYGEPLQNYVVEKNRSALIQFYSQSKVNLTANLVTNLGFHSQYFMFNGHYTFEPRFGIRWDFTPRQHVSFAYGLHTQLEKIYLYLLQQQTTDGTVMPNKNLDFAKSHHFVLGYYLQINDNSVIKIEPYYQRLFNIPVVPQSYLSTINLLDLWNFRDTLINNGTGRNIGLDFSLERYLDKNYYYLFTASIFDSKYTGGDGIERNTRYNKNYVFNFLGGKEWQVGKTKNNLFSINLRFTYMGGDRIIPLNYGETIAREEIVEDTGRAYELKLADAPVLSGSIIYRINKPGHSGILSFQIINALGYREFQEYEFNAETKKIEKVEDLLIIPNISYKIEF